MNVPYSEIVAALECSAGNTDTDPRWLAASELRRLDGHLKINSGAHDRLLAAAKFAMAQIDPSFYPIAREQLKAAIAAAEELAP